MCQKQGNADTNSWRNEGLQKMRDRDVKRLRGEKTETCKDSETEIRSVYLQRKSQINLIPFHQSAKVLWS
jgi:hypothetical protein